MKNLPLVILLFLFNLGFTQEIEDLLSSRKFVLEAQKSTDEEGLVSQAMRKLCFIRLDSNDVVIQWISDCDNNGLGGITLHGDILKFEIEKQEIDNEIQHKVHMDCKMECRSSAEFPKC